IVSDLEEPLADTAAYALQQICSAARRRGVPILLTGVGGDDLFGGERRHLLMALERWRGLVPPAARRLVARSASRLRYTSDVARRLRKTLCGLELDTPRYLASLFEWLPSPSVDALLGGPYADARDG